MEEEILATLHQDHVNLSRLMRIIAHELDELEAGREPDYELVEDILRYITGYSDIHHHPTEDLVYDELRKISPEAAGEVEEIVAQHHGLIDQGRAFLEAIEAVEEAAIIRRDRLLDSGRKYLTALGRHMGTEEGKLFPLAAERLSAESWSAVEAGAQQPPDPLFGESVEREYQTLWQRIEAHSAGS